MAHLAVLIVVKVFGSCSLGPSQELEVRLDELLLRIVVAVVPIRDCCHLSRQVYVSKNKRILGSADLWHALAGPT